MSILRRALSPGCPGLEINHPLARARVAQQGAQILGWTPSGQAPVLYLSPQAVCRPGAALRGGVPVCWPWFGPHPTDPAGPSHGVARTRCWELGEVAEHAAGVDLQFILTDSVDSRQTWPEAFRLELAMRIGAELRLTLRMVNTGDRPWTATGALHTYLAVGDIRQVYVTGLEGADYLDEAARPPTVRRQEGEVRFAGEVDRDYRSAGLVRVHDPALGRVVEVEGSGSQCCVVWNPWIDKAKSLADLPDRDYERFVCVETANAWEDRVVVEPGGVHTLGTVLRVR